MNYSIGLAALVIAVGSVMAAPAQAAVEVTEVGANAVSLCQGSLPAFETALRKRPMAVQNEGASSSFVTCSFSSQYDSEDMSQIGYFGVFFNNTTATAKSVTCTGVAGFAANATNVFVNKTVTVAGTTPTVPGEGEVFFEPIDNGGQGYYPLVNVSCNIPPGVGIADTYVGFNLDDA